MNLAVGNVNAMGNVQVPAIRSTEEVEKSESIDAFETDEPEENDLLDLSVEF